MSATLAYVGMLCCRAHVMFRAGVPPTLMFAFCAPHTSTLLLHSAVAVSALKVEWNFPAGLSE